MATIETRLAFLERKEKIHSAELQRLTDENVSLMVENSELKATVYDLKREQLQTDKMLKATKNMVKELSAIKGSDGATVTFSNLTSQYKRLTETLKELTTKVNLHALQNQSNWKAFAEERNKTKSLQQILNRVMVACQGKKRDFIMQRLETDVRLIKNQLDEQKKSIFIASVKPSRSLSQNSETELDLCERVYHDSVHFKRFNNKCSYIVPGDGMYLVGAKTRQEGSGSLGVGVKFKKQGGDESDTGCIMSGTTTKDRPLLTIQGSFKLLKGEKLYVEVFIESGNPKFEYCSFKAFLLCPL